MLFCLMACFVGVRAAALPVQADPYDMESADSAAVANDFSLSEAVVTGARYETDIRHLPMTVSVVNRGE